MTNDAQLDRCWRLVAIKAGEDYDATLYALTIGLRAQLIYEVGVGGSLSTHAFLSALQHTGGRLISCDIADLGNEVTTDWLAARWEFRHQSSEEFVQGLEGRQADLIYLDGCHAFPTIFWEVQAFWPLLKVDGLMVLHDTRWHPDGPGWVMQMVREQGIEAAELPYAFGIGIIHKRADDPEKLELEIV